MKEMDQLKFGENLKLLRKEHKLSQEELADKLDVSRQAVSKWENGVAYPEMNNILELCKIFKCQINDLVHTEMSDITAFSKDIVSRVVKFDEEKQTKVKQLSSIISLIGKIGSIVLKVAIPFIIIVIFLVPYLINNLEVVNGEIIASSDKITIINDTKIEVGNFMLIELDRGMSLYDLVMIFEKYSKMEIIIYLECGLLLLIIELVMMIIILNKVYKLFKNIKEKSTPFILENVKYIKNISYLMIGLIMINPIGEILFDYILGTTNGDGIELIYILEIFFSMTYIFEYGYEIQKDSVGKMYN